jgi:acetyl/propionyl-CoA carboxylase alpha subunit
VPFRIKGIETTLPFGEFVFGHEAFISGKFDTHFVKNYFTPETYHNSSAPERKIAAVIAVKNFLKEVGKASAIAHPSDDWRTSRL